MHTMRLICYLINGVNPEVISYSVVSALVLKLRTVAGDTN